MARLKKRKVKSADAIMAGDEPFLAEVIDSTSSDYIRALNWYAYICDKKKGRVWLLQWMKDNGYSRADMSAIRKVSDSVVKTTPLWIARMSSNGTKMLETSMNYLKGHVAELIEIGQTIIEEKEAEEDDKPVLSIQDRIMIKNKHMLTMVEEAIDRWIDGEEFSLYDFLVGEEASEQAANYILGFYKPIMDEAFLDDEQVKEGYGKDLKKWQTFYKDLVDDAKRYVRNKKATKKIRKPRAKKEKPLSKVVEKLNYMKEFGDLKLVSVDPQKVVGASQLWTYNTKNRKISVFHAMSRDGFGIKGTSLTGFDPEKSISKTARKPEIVTSEVLNAGKVQIRRIMDNLTTKDSPANGRMNDSTILLRVIK